MNRALWALVALVMTTTIIAVGGVAWLIGTESGARWALERARAASAGRLTIAGAGGTLARGVRLERLAYSEPGIDIQASDLWVRAALGRVFAGQLALEAVTMRSLDVHLAQRDGPRPELPERITLPLELIVERLQIARLTLRTGHEPMLFTEVGGNYRGGRQSHRVDELHFQSPWGRVALSGEVGVAAPFPGSASGSLDRPDDRYPAGVGVSLRGDAHRMEAELTLSIGPHLVSHGNAVLSPLEAQWLAALQLSAEGIDLERLNAALPHTALDFRLEARGTPDELLAGSLVAENRLAAPAPGVGRLPISRLATRFATDFSKARLEGLHLSLVRGGTVSGRGEINAERARLALHSPEGVDLDLRVELGSKDMPFDARIKLAAFNPSRLGEYPEGALSGSVLAHGALRGPRELDVRWTLADSVVRGHVLESRGSARVSELRATRLDAQARVGANRLAARGAFGKPGDRIEWTLDAPRLADLDPRLAGRLGAKGTLEGGWGSAQVALDAQATALVLPAGVSAKSVTAQAKFGQADDAPLALEISAAMTSANNLLLDRFSASVSGTRAKHEARMRARAKGFDVRAQLRGGWHDSDWQGALISLTNEGTYPLRLLAPVPLQVSATSVALGRFDAALGEGRLLVREALVASGRLSSSGEFSGLPASWVLVPAGLGGRLRSTLRLEGRWSLASSPRLTGELSARRASGDLVVLGGDAPVALGLERATLDARFVDGQLGAHVRADSRFGNLSVQGELTPLEEASGLGFTPDSPVVFNARFDVAEVQALAAPYLTQGRVDGRLAAEVQGTGTLASPVLAGTLSGDRLRLDLPPHGIYLRDGRLRARLEGDTLRVTELSVRGGEGALVATGTLPLRRDGERSLEWRATQFRLLDQPDRRLFVSGNGLVRFDGERFRLTGEARADRAHIELKQDRLPQLGDDVVVIGQPRAPLGEKARSPLELELELDLGENFVLRGRGFDGRLEGRLRVIGHRNGELLAYGKLSAVNATYLAYGRKLEVDPGALIFDGPIDNPALQVTAWRRNQTVEAGVQLTGTAQAPSVRLVSKPNVPEGERLSWLVLGRAPTDASGADLGLLQTAAGALLGRGNAAPVTDRIARAAGLDEIGLRGGGELSEQVVAFGKRLSDRLYVSYEQGVGATAANLIKLDFALTQHLSVRAETGTTSGWGLFYRFSWD